MNTMGAGGDLDGDFVTDTVVEIPIPTPGIAVPQVLKYILTIFLCLFLEYVLQLLPRCVDFIRNRWSEVQAAFREAWRKPRTLRKAVRSLIRLFRKWEIFTVPGITFVLVYYCAIHSLTHLPNFYATPDNIELWTLQEQTVDLTPTGVSVTAPVRDPRGNSPYHPRSYKTTNYFCGRPTGSSYDGFAGAPHAAYIHHDMDRDRFVVRTFGRGGTRVDHRRRMGIGRSTYEVFCGASVEAQTATPLAPSVLEHGDDNWQLDHTEPRVVAVRSDFNFTLEQLAAPLPTRATADPLRNNFLKADQGLRTHYRRYTRAEILAAHRHLDFIYSYVNGSDITRGYTKPFAKNYICWNLIAAVQFLWGELQRLRDGDAAGRRVSEDSFARYVSEILFTKSKSPCSMVKLLSSVGQGKDAMAQVEASLWWTVTHINDEDSEAAAVPAPYALTNIELLRAIGAERDTVWMDAIDTDCDELRHSMRGLLQHTRGWSRGRVTIVSPYSNVPQWLNQSKNFFLRSIYANAIVNGLSSNAGKAAGERPETHTPLGTAQFCFAREANTKQLHYTRVHVVDQRALMPPAPITTVNSYVIEPFVYLLRNVSSVFVYMNDDYLIMKDVDVFDFVNSFGGPVLRISREDSMEYYESTNDYFRRGFVFNTMRMHRDVDKLPADLEELIQPSSLEAAVSQRTGESPQLQRGIVRGDWAAFTAAVNTHGTTASFEQRCAHPNDNEGGVNDTICAWLECVRSAAASLPSCPLPRVSVAGEPTWEVDAGGIFEQISTADSKRVWAGHAQTPHITDWGRRVLDRVAADIVAPRYYLETDTVVLRDNEANPTPPEYMARALQQEVAAVEEVVNQVGEDADDTSGARDKMLRVFTGWMEVMMEHNFPTHRTFKTMPRLRKYRVRLDSHAPYPQCRNMWRYIHKRYAPDLNLNMFLMRKRSTLDFLPPSTHTVHMLRHPWAGSSQYIPYLMAKEAWRLQMAEQQQQQRSSSTSEAPLFPVVDVVLDNEDGCAPATYITEELQSACYHEFRNDRRQNERVMNKIRSYRGRKPFTNINSKFTIDSVGVTLRNFLEELFPTPMLLEEDWVAEVSKKTTVSSLDILADLDDKNSKDALTFHDVERNFRRFTRLPLILVSNDEEGFCPLLRSLRHAMPAFRGLRVVQVLVPPADGRTLYTARAEQRHAYRNFLPVTRCTLAPGRLTRVTLPADSSMADIIVAALRSAREGLEERHWAAPALVELRGLRVARRAVQAVVLDARTLHGGAAGFAELPHALATPAELLAHEDFAEVLLDGEAYSAAQAYVRVPTDAEAAAPATVTLGDEKVGGARGKDYVSSVLVLSEAEARQRNVHWAYGASEHDLLSGMPLPYLKLEDRDVNVKWGY
jgi:hypothetical protein